MRDVPPLRLLGISGSMRRASTNGLLLRAAAQNAPGDVELCLFERLGEIPIFNPDRDVEPWPPSVLDLRASIRHADGLVIASPEYAHGIPGGLKNALDWLVSGSEVPGKPVALFHASARSTHGRAALAEVLRTMSLTLMPEHDLTVPMLGFDGGRCAALLTTREIEARLHMALGAYAAALRHRLVPPSASLGTATDRSHIHMAGERPGLGQSAQLEGRVS